jgi:hypothetical protein
MKSDAIAYTVAGMCFGIILGWVIGTQQANRAAAPQVAQNTASQAAQPAAPANGQRQPPPLDEARVQSLTTILNSDPNNASATRTARQCVFRRGALL